MNQNSEEKVKRRTKAVESAHREGEREIVKKDGGVRESATGWRSEGE